MRIHDSDGGIGTGYTYTIGTGGPSVIALLEKTLAPALIGKEANRIDAIWRELLFLTHATSADVACVKKSNSLQIASIRFASLPIRAGANVFSSRAITDGPPVPIV